MKQLSTDNNSTAVRTHTHKSTSHGCVLQNEPTLTKTDFKPPLDETKMFSVHNILHSIGSSLHNGIQNFAVDF